MHVSQIMKTVEDFRYSAKRFYSMCTYYFTFSKVEEASNMEPAIYKF